MKMKAVIAALLIALPAARAEDPSAAAEAPRVASVPAEVRAQFKLSPFYEKYVDLDGLPIVASAAWSDAAAGVRSGGAGAIRDPVNPRRVTN